MIDRLGRLWARRRLTIVLVALVIDVLFSGCMFFIAPSQDRQGLGLSLSLGQALLVMVWVLPLGVILGFLVAMDQEKSSKMASGHTDEPVTAPTASCSRCGAPAEWKFALTGELACGKCFNQAGVCQGCARDFGSDAALIKIGARKSCSKCRPHFERQLAGIDRQIDDFIGGRR